MRSKLLVFVGLILGSTTSLFAQESILKKAVEGQQYSVYALYPSTIRMVNIQGNKDFDELSGSIKKLLIYHIADSVMDFAGLEKEFIDEGFEEFARVFGGDTQFTILGDKNEMTGWFSEQDKSYVFYLSGQVNWQKIPALMNSFKEEEFLNFFDLNKPRRERKSVRDNIAD